MLGGEFATHLTGRYIKTELYPFSFREFCLWNQISTDADTTRQRGLLRSQLDLFIQEGGMPGLYTETRKTAYIDTLVNNIITNDIERRYKMRYKSTFEKITHHILNNVPIAINYKNLLKALVKASEDTGCSNLMLLTLSDEDTIQMEEKTIAVVPVYQWLLTEEREVI